MKILPPKPLLIIFFFCRFFPPALLILFHALTHWTKQPETGNERVTSIFSLKSGGVIFFFRWQDDSFKTNVVLLHSSKNGRFPLFVLPFVFFLLLPTECHFGHRCFPSSPLRSTQPQVLLLFFFWVLGLLYYCAKICCF